MVALICKYNQNGYCKFGNNCRNRHVEEICSSAQCQQLSCEMRHPFICKFYRMYGNCKFENNCAFLHEASDEQLKISLLEEKFMHPDVLVSITISVAKLASENKNDKLPCEYCRANEFFDSEHDVLEHIKTAHPIQCPYCPLKMFKYPTSVRKHFRKFHEDDTPYFCKDCTLVFTDQETVQDHMENEHAIPNVVVVTNIVQQNPFQNVFKSGITCIVCGENNFESAQDLIEHRSETHMYNCLDCDKEYKLTDSLRNHIRMHHNSNVNMTCCKFCDKVFYDTRLKSGHVSTMHADCSGTVETEKSLYKCPKCSKGYNIAKSLRKHCRVNHNNLSICFCDYCLEVFVSSVQRDAHQDKEHPSNKNSSSKSATLQLSPESCFIKQEILNEGSENTMESCFIKQEVPDESITRIVFFYKELA